MMRLPRYYLHDIRTQKHFTQEDMFLRLDVDRRHYAFIESGQRCIRMSVKKVKELSDALEVDFGELSLMELRYQMEAERMSKKNAK
jgi:transcriptional regulator with XRE-family HTH domain